MGRKNWRLAASQIRTVPSTEAVASNCPVLIKQGKDAAAKMKADDPKVKEAVIKALIYPTTAYKEKFVPPSAINWNDADDNNAFHAKTIVMDLDGTISTEGGPIGRIPVRGRARAGDRQAGG